MNTDFDASDANRETQNGLSSITGFPRQPDTRNLDMFADVAVARRQREKEGFNSDAAGIREYQSTMHWRGLTRPNAALRKKGASADEAIEL